MSRFGIGTVLAERYRLDSLIGQGGMGSVWRAHHLRLNSPVAIKLIDPAIANNPETIERFIREAQAAAALRSPHVVQTLDYGVHENVPYIAMELMAGESLAQRLERVGILSPAETVKVLTHVGRAVAKAHDLGIVHRDLKPDNVFLVNNDDEEVAKVLDFGIAKLTSSSLTSSSSTRTGTVMGTPYYMSPEQAEGTKAVDARTDIWALGVIAVECLTGQRPFEGSALGDVILKICSKPIPVPSTMGPVMPGFDAWFARACSRDLDQRFASVRELTEALRALVTSSTEPGPSTSKPRKIQSGPTVVPVVATRTGDTSLPVSNTPRNLAIALGLIAAAGVAAFALTRSTDGNDTSAAAAESATPIAPEPATIPKPVTAPEPHSTSESRPAVALPPTTTPIVEPAAGKATAQEAAAKPTPPARQRTPRPTTRPAAPPPAPDKTAAAPPPAPAPPRVAKPSRKDDDYGF